MRSGWFVGIALPVLLVTGCQPDGSTPGAGERVAAASPAPEVDSRTAAPVRPATGRTTAPGSKQAIAAPLLHAAAGGDGDSWKDTQGVEYRLGLVNTPELSECYGEVASRKRKQLTAPGFRATSYTVDQYGRRVSVVYLTDGTNLNVWLARHGYANDRYLKEFRHENRPLAAQLDAAFAEAKREHAGLWAACGTAQPQGFAAQAAPATRGNCEPSYPDVCIPPAPPDLDCPDISYRRFTVLPPDPHGFDADGDGVGCESG